MLQGINLLSHVGLTCSARAIQLKLEQVRHGHDHEVLEWKQNTEKHSSKGLVIDKLASVVDIVVSENLHPIPNNETLKASVRY